MRLTLIATESYFIKSLLKMVSQNTVLPIINLRNGLPPVQDTDNHEVPSVLLNGDGGKAEARLVENLNISDQFQEHIVTDSLPRANLVAVAEKSKKNTTHPIENVSVANKLSSLIGIPQGEINPTAPLSELGLDSFLASEFQNVNQFSISRIC